MSFRVYDKEKLKKDSKKLLNPFKELIEKTNKVLEKAGLKPPKDATKDDPVPPDTPEES